MHTSSPNPNRSQDDMVFPEVQAVVTELKFEKGTVYVCEICGYGYQSISIAERCEQHCDTRMRPSRRIRQKAVYQPPVEVLPTILVHDR